MNAPQEEDDQGDVSGEEYDFSSLLLNNSNGMLNEWVRGTVGRRLPMIDAVEYDTRRRFLMTTRLQFDRVLGSVHQRAADLLSFRLYHQEEHPSE